MAKPVLKTRSSKASKNMEQFTKLAKDADKQESTSLNVKKIPPSKKVEPVKPVKSITPIKPTELAGIKSPILKTPMSDMAEMSSPRPGVSPVSPVQRDVMRFSDRTQTSGKGNSTMRVLVFLLIVVAVGVGLTLFVQNYISTQNSATASSSSSQSVEPLPDGIELATLVLSDTAATKVNANDVFVNAESKVGSAANNVEAARLANVKYDAYTTFSRTTITFTGLVKGLPATTVMLEGDTVVITALGVRLQNINMAKLFNLELGNLKSISLSEDPGGVQVRLEPTSEGKYFVELGSDNNSILVDFKTIKQLGLPTSSSTSSDSSSSTSSVSSSVSSSSSSSSISSVSSSSSSSAASSSSSLAAGETQFTNNKSQNSQQIVSEVNTKSIKMQSFYYQDFGPYFEFSWAMGGTTDASVPNTTASLIQSGGVNYIEVKISNLSQDLFYAKGWTSADLSGVNLTYSNLKAVQFKSKSNDVSTYWVKLGGKSDYRLRADKTKNGYRLLTVQVYD